MQGTTPDQAPNAIERNQPDIASHENSKASEDADEMIAQMLEDRLLEYPWRSPVRHPLP